MTEFRPDPFDRPAPQPAPEGGGMIGRRLVLALVGLGAVAVAAAGIWFAYDQGVKRGAGGGPMLIKADNGPVKTAPENPGGMQVPNQDKQVFERLTGQYRTGACQRHGTPAAAAGAAECCAHSAKRGNLTVGDRAQSQHADRAQSVAGHRGRAEPHRCAQRDARAARSRSAPAGPAAAGGAAQPAGAYRRCTGIGPCRHTGAGRAHRYRHTGRHGQDSARLAEGPGGGNRDLECAAEEIPGRARRAAAFV